VRGGHRRGKPLLAGESVDGRAGISIFSWGGGIFLDIYKVERINKMVLQNYQIDGSDLAISTTTDEGNDNVLVLSRDGVVALRMPLGEEGIVALEDNNNQYVFTGRQYGGAGTFQLKIPKHEEDHEEYSYQLYFNNFLVCDMAIDGEVEGAEEFYNKLLEIGGLQEAVEEAENMNQNGGRRRRRYRTRRVHRSRQLRRTKKN
jgi:hypothetical protein